MTQSWEETAQSWGGKLLDVWGAQVKNDQDYEIAKLRLTTLGPGGYAVEGQRGVSESASPSPGGLPPNALLLIGAAVVAVLVLKD